MTGFYVAMILFGAFIAAIALAVIVADKNRDRDYRLDVTERRDRLVETMEDAEVLVEEMNRFSDYVVTTCEEKNREVSQVIRRADSLVGQVASACAVLESRLAVSRVEAASTTVSSATGAGSATGVASATDVSSATGVASAIGVSSATGVASATGVSSAAKASSATGMSHVPDFSVAVASDMSKPKAVFVREDAVRGRVLPLDARRAEALRLARKGMPVAEIARSLQLGKGEIELITRTRSGS